MPETSNPDVPVVAAALVSETPVTPGQLLRAARLKSGVHLAVLSVTLKVPVKELEALEADQVDPTKGAVFVRALASSVCRQLRMDPAPVLALLPQGVQHLPPQRSVSPMSSSSRALGSRSISSTRPHARQATILVAVMLLLTAALIWLPGPSEWAWLDQLPRFSKAEPAVGTASEPVFMVPSGAVFEPMTSASDQAVSQAAQVMVSVASQASSPSSSASTASVAFALPTGLTSNVSPSELVFSASEPSWIEVRDAGKQVLWSGVLSAGEKKQIQNALPLNVVVGRAQGVTLTVRGQPFDLKPHTQVTVARFELKP
jgi:cytoskeleton protein RodZ